MVSRLESTGAAVQENTVLVRALQFFCGGPQWPRTKASSAATLARLLDWQGCVPNVTAAKTAQARVPVLPKALHKPILLGLRGLKGKAAFEHNLVQKFST